MTKALNNKYVLFQVGDEEYGMKTSDVLSVERMQPVHKMPLDPEHMLGTFTLRGSVLRLVDLPKYLLDKPAEQTDETRIVIMTTEKGSLGMLVDKATDVRDIEPENIDNGSLLVSKSGFIHGIAKLNGRLVTILDTSALISQLLVPEDQEQVA